MLQIFYFLFQLETAYEVAVRDMPRNGIDIQWNKVINADQIEQSIAEIKVLLRTRIEFVLIFMVAASDMNCLFLVIVLQGQVHNVFDKCKL